VIGLVLGGVATAAALGLYTTMTFDENACLLACTPGRAVRASALSGAVVGASLGALFGAGFAPPKWERVW
jgi:hypothetical protein